MSRVEDSNNSNQPGEANFANIDGKGNSLLHNAASTGTTSLLCFLIDMGANMNIKDSEDHTPYSGAEAICSDNKDNTTLHYIAEHQQALSSSS
ncbi:hypothetical protein BJX99DRAFT_258929 [Aspergillus californicus]